MARKPAAPRKADTSSRTATPRNKRDVPDASPAGLAAQAEAREQAAKGCPFNPLKGEEYGPASARPPAGKPRKVAAIAAASTLSEHRTNAKTGTAPPAGRDALADALLRTRGDDGGQRLTTNQGVPIADNQHSLKAGLRGPALLKDFILREKLTHFDHERIPERIVHARGSGAHGYFECYKALGKVTRAALFSEAGKRTPVFVRFSTVAGERGSKDTARDARGFAVKFYTEEGNWDLVGNNIPVFFIQDAMKFPDLVHAVKPEPHNGMPQAASAHDTFWDFVSLMPESTHMLLWKMSGRALPRSFRMMQGFGVHTFRFVNAAGKTTLVKFHWTPKLGTHSLAWDEAVKISGCDPDFHRRDLWDAIEAGEFPEWELGVQLFTEEQAESFSFDVLDPTKIVPEELVPVRPIGRLVLDRNPDNFFAETEQVAFCAAHVVPGIDFTNDPLLAGRIHSYVDTQISRLGGPNFHELPINAPLAPVHNNQRDGMHRQTVHRGAVAYEPNSLGGGCPFQAGAAGFVPFPEPIQADELRGHPEKFAEHYNQATLFYDSQTPSEQDHIVAAFRFELSKVTVPAIRQRVLSQLRNVSDDLASRVAEGLGMGLPEPMPRALRKSPTPEVTVSPALSLTARPGELGIRTLRIAVLIADRVDAAAVEQVVEALEAEGAMPRLVGPRLGTFTTNGKTVIEADASLETEPGVVFDAVIAPGGAAMSALAADGRAIEFLQQQFRHGKPMLALGDGEALFQVAGIVRDDAPEPGVLVEKTARGAMRRFIDAVAQRRFPERETDPPRV